MKCRGFLLACLLCSVAAAAQDLACNARDIVVHAADKQGTRLRLDPSHLRAQIGHERGSVESTGVVAKQRRAVILLDSSGSMHGAARWDLSLRLVRELLSKLPPAIQVGFVVGNLKNGSQIPLGLASRQVIGAVLQRIATEVTPSSSWGRTALYRWMDDARNLFVKANPGDAVYVVSDGGDNVGKPAMVDVLRRYVSSGITVNAVIIAESSSVQLRDFIGPGSLTGSVTPEDIIRLRELRQFALDTGGRVVEIDPRFVAKTDSARAGILKAITDLANDEGFTVNLRAPTQKRWSKLKLEATDDSGAIRKDVFVEYPRWWPPCPAP